MFVELYALKCFFLGCFIAWFGLYFYFKYRYECKHFEIVGLWKVKSLGHDSKALVLDRSKRLSLK